MRIIDALEIINKTTVESVQTVLRSKGKIATSETFNSLRTQISVGDGTFTGEVFGSGGLKFIESGRKPNSKMPPSGVLLDWMRSKGIDEDREFVIRRAIAINGIPPTTIISDAIKSVQEQHKKILSDAVRDEVFTTIIKEAL